MNTDETLNVEAPEAETEFTLEGVTQYFLTPDNEPFLAMRDVDATFKAGEFICIIGPSGCGKSTLLNIVAGLLQPTEGTVLHRGRALSGVNTAVGYLTQHDHLLPWRSVEKNVGLALEIQHVPRDERKHRVHNALAMVGLESFGKAYPSQLSGGMQKRAALARMLIYEPDTLLMDEPFAALDALLRTIMQRQLMSLWEQHKKTVLFITHDLEEAILLADKIIVFGTKPGRIIHTEELDLPRPRTLEELRSSDQFNEIWSRLWSMIEDQLSTAQAGA